MLSGLGCDCSTQDTDGNCLDPSPCPGDSASFGSQTGIQYTEPLAQAGYGQVYTNANATPGTVSTAISTTTNTSTTVTSSCNQTLVSGICDWIIYVGIGVVGLMLLGGSSGGRHR